MLLAAMNRFTPAKKNNLFSWNKVELLSRSRRVQDRGNNHAHACGPQRPAGTFAGLNSTLRVSAVDARLAKTAGNDLYVTPEGGARHLTP